MTDTAAREEAFRRWPLDEERDWHKGFMAGAEWRDAQVAELVKAARMCRDVTNEDEDIEAWTALVAALEAFEGAPSVPVQKGRGSDDH